jgi:outer membrane protein OmpA-like peptidoglycan-associated protein
MRCELFADAFSPYAYFNRIDTETMESGSIRLKGELDLDFVFHKLGNGWSSHPDPMGINKIFNYKWPYANPDNKWNDLYQQKLLLNVAVKPFNWFVAQFGFEILGDYADRYWVPVNEEHRLHSEVKRFDWNNAKVGITQDWGSLFYYRSYANTGWKYEGDMFDMLPAEDLPDNLLRYSGHYAPEYFQFKTSGSFGDIDAVYGIEALENYKKGIYLKYKDIFGSKINFFYSDHIIPFGFNDERMRNFQLNTDIKILGATLHLGALYRPFRINSPYQYVKDVGRGAGLYGSRYNVKVANTKNIEALGGAVKLNIPEFLTIDMLSFRYEYRGLVAGNRQKAEASLEKQLTYSINSFIHYFYQKPLINAMPTVYSGTNGDGAGPLIMSGRSPESPFWVWWRNPVTGFDNRETSEISAVFTYDRTPETWFYNYDPDKPAMYNIGPDEDSGFSCALKVSFAKYFETLDRQVHWDYKGDVSWEPIGMNGTAPTDKYIGSLYTLVQFAISKTKILADAEIGKDPATLSYAYSNRESFLVPIIGYFKTSLAVEANPYLLKFAYLKSYWGPEYWHRQFGLTYDNLYLVHVSRNLGDVFNIGAEYVRAEKTDAAILNNITGSDTETNELGSFDEIRVFVKLFFNTVGKFRSPKEVAPPKVSVALSDAVIFPEQDNKITIIPKAFSELGIDRWNIYIKGTSGNIVKTYSGINEPMKNLEWDGKNEKNGRVLPEDTYYVTIEAWDKNEGYSISESVQVRLITDIADVKVQSNDTEIQINMDSDVLFDFARSTLKPKALKVLNKALRILQLYEGDGILVEGHTDSVGGLKYNQDLSEKRAESVVRYLIEHGIEEKRINTKGYGEVKPISSNRTSSGRRKNRRVQISILRDKFVDKS